MCRFILDNGQGNVSVMCGQSPDIEPTPEITVISAPSPSNPITKCELYVRQYSFIQNFWRW